MQQINLKLNDELNARIESEAGSKRERAGWIRELVRDELGPDLESEPDTGHYPEKERDRKIYEALLEHGGDSVLKGYVRMDDVKPEIAQTTRTEKDAIYQSMKRMERHHHVRLDHGMFSGDVVRVRARPPQADPDQWIRAKGRDRPANAATMPSLPSDDSEAKRKLREEIEAANDEFDKLTNTEVPADD